MNNPINKYIDKKLPKVGFPTVKNEKEILEIKEIKNFAAEILDKFQNTIDVKLEIKLSENIPGEYGVFIDEDISKGKIINIDYRITKKINDLAYRPGEKYCLANVAEYTNCKLVSFGFYEQDSDLFADYLVTGQIPKKKYMIIKDLKKGDELSRVYGPEYWKNFEFWDKYPDNKFLLTNRDEDLPPDWVNIANIRSRISNDKSFELYAKKENNKYHYGFIDNSGKFNDVSKPNFELMNSNELINFHGLKLSR